MVILYNPQIMAAPERGGDCLVVEEIGQTRQISLDVRMMSMSALKLIVYLQIACARNADRFVLISGKGQEGSMIIGHDDLMNRKDDIANGNESGLQAFFDRVEATLANADRMTIIERVSSPHERRRLGEGRPPSSR